MRQPADATSCLQSFRPTNLFGAFESAPAVPEELLLSVWYTALSTETVSQVLGAHRSFLQALVQGGACRSAP
jgi:hypothetical protein